MNKLLKIAMESDEVAAVAGVDADESKTVKVEPGEDAIIITGKDIAIIDAEGDAVADSVEAAEDAAEEADELDEDIDEAEGAVEALEAMAIVLESSIEKGQMDATGVKLLKIATESIFSRLDMPESHSVLAMESIRERAGVVTGTAGAQIALEDLKDRIKQIWEAIKAGMMKVMEYLREFSKKVMDALPSMENRAKKLLEVSGQLSGSPRLEVVGNKAMFDNLRGENMLASRLPGELAKLVVMTKTACAPKVTDSMLAVAQKIEQAEGNGEKLLPVIAIIENVMAAGLVKTSDSQAKSLGVPDAPQGCEIYTSGRLIGGAVIWSHVPTTVETIPTVASGVAYDEPSKSKDIQWKTLEPRQIGEVAKTVLQFTALKSQLANVDKSIDAVNKMVLGMTGSRKFVETVQKSETAGEVLNKGAKEYFAAVRAIKVLLKGVHAPAIQVTARACAAALNYAAASAKAYGATADVKALAAA